MGKQYISDANFEHLQPSQPSRFLDGWEDENHPNQMPFAGRFRHGIWILRFLAPSFNAETPAGSRWHVARLQPASSVRLRNVGPVSCPEKRRAPTHNTERFKKCITFNILKEHESQYTCLNYGHDISGISEYHLDACPFHLVASDGFAEAGRDPWPLYVTSAWFSPGI